MWLVRPFPLFQYFSQEFRFWWLCGPAREAVVDTALSTKEWFPTFLIRYDGQSSEAAGFECALGAMLGALVGSTLGAKACKRWQQEAKNIYMLVPAIATLVSIWACVACLSFRIYYALPLIALSGFYMSAFAVNTVALSVLTTTVFTSRELSLAISVQTISGCGLLAPVVVGWLSDKMHSLRSALVFPTLVQALSGLLLLICSQWLGASGTESSSQDEQGNSSLLSLFDTVDELESEEQWPSEQKSVMYGSI